MVRENPACTTTNELCPGLQPATPQCSATCKILSQGHPINQRIVFACHLQHSMSVLVSFTGYHPRPRHTEHISNIQTCTCLTKIRNRSVAFVPQHVGSTGAKWSATVESSQCFLLADDLTQKFTPMHIKFSKFRFVQFPLTSPKTDRRNTSTRSNI